MILVTNLHGVWHVAIGRDHNVFTLTSMEARPAWLSTAAQFTCRHAWCKCKNHQSCFYTSVSIEHRLQDKASDQPTCHGVTNRQQICS